MKYPLPHIRLSAFLIIAVFSAGCSGLLDVPKKIWGSSTKDLEEARGEAIHKTFHCSAVECFDAVLKLTVMPKEEDTLILAKTTEPVVATQTTPPPPAYRPNRPADDPSTPVTPPSMTYLQLFMKDRQRNFIVVMGVPNCVNTTEVGIFLAPLEAGNVKVELSSLSTKAKRNAAEVVFAHLGKQFPEIQ